MHRTIMTKTMFITVLSRYVVMIALFVAYANEVVPLWLLVVLVLAFEFAVERFQRLGI